jgi:hypothetical protein
MNTLLFCNKYLENYTINPDDTIDVNGGVYLWYKLGDMEELPVKFGKVSGDFSCGFNKLTTLEGFPSYIGDNFYTDILTHHVNVQGNIFCTKQRIVI